MLAEVAPALCERKSITQSACKTLCIGNLRSGKSQVLTLERVNLDLRSLIIHPSACLLMESG